MAGGFYLVIGILAGGAMGMILACWLATQHRRHPNPQSRVEVPS